MAKGKQYLQIAAAAGIALVLSGCKQRTVHRSAPQAKPVAVRQAPPTPIETTRVERGGPSWDPAWDTLIERSLPPAMLSSRVPRDVRRFCPRFFEMSPTNKRTYWAYFFQALSAAEAGLNADANAAHRDPAVPTRTEGLLQLSYADQKRYGCNFDWKADRALPLRDPRRTILNPENNLECGIKILQKQIIARRKPLFAESSYWSTLRTGTASYRVFARQMTNPPAACGLQERAERPQAARQEPRKIGATRGIAVAQP